jgi:hypothetical protein
VESSIASPCEKLLIFHRISRFTITSSAIQNPSPTHMTPTQQELLDLQFIAVRHQLIDVAAFLDRLDRHPGPPDYRVDALRAALPILLTDRPDRARAVLESLSDHSIEPIPKAAFQGAFGAPLPA